MVIRTNNIFKSVGATCFAGALALGGLSGCEQQGAACATAHGGFAVKLTMKGDTAGACADNLGGVFGAATYNYVGDEGRPDLDRASMAIQAEALGITVAEAEGRLGETADPDGKMYARGDFATSEPDGKEVCSVPSLTKAEVNIPLLPLIPAVPDDPATEEDESEPEVPEVPATTYVYDWSNVKFLVSEANQGTRFTGTLKYSVDDCTAEYDAVGLYPAVFCADEEGNPVDGLCSAEPIADLGMVTGSGISPDFVTKCDPDLLLCVLAERPATE